MLQEHNADMISMERSLRHMAWANEQVFNACLKLPWRAMGSYVVDEEWVAGRILYHLTESASFYLHGLGVRPWQPIAIPESMDDMRSLGEQLAAFDAMFLGVARLDDELLTFQDDDGTRRALRSTMLAQVIHHACEHRAQLLDALNARGHNPISLDDIDLWAFEERVG